MELSVEGQTGVRALKQVRAANSQFSIQNTENTHFFTQIPWIEYIRAFNFSPPRQVLNTCNLLWQQI